MKLRYLPLIVTLLGCEKMGDAVFSVVDSPGTSNSNRPVCTSKEDGKRWDLGTGFAFDMRRTAPGFLSLRPEGWTMPDQPDLAQQAMNQQPNLEIDNRRRLDALIMKAEGIEPKPSRVDDVQAFDLITQPIVTYKIRRFVVVDKAAILITPGTCRHVFAADQCKGGRLTTEVTTSGTVKCVGPFTAPAYLMIAFDSQGSDKVRLDLGKPLLGVPGGSKFSMFSPEGKPLGNAERGIDEYADATPDEVLATLTLETEQPASNLWKNVPEILRTKDAIERVTKTRVAAVTTAAGEVHDPQGALRFGASRRINGTLPGDEAVATFVRAKLVEGAKQLDEPTSEKFRLGISLVKLLKLYKGTDDDVQATGIEMVYGPLFTAGTLKDPKDRQTFLTTFPKSDDTEKLLALMQKEADADEARGVARQKEAEVGGDFAGLAETADKIITTRWQAGFVTSHLDMMRNQRRSLAGANAFKGEADRMQREEFCPARREFVKKYGAKELQGRAKEKCDSEPPTATGEFGRDVRLDKECRAIFTSGC